MAQLVRASDRHLEDPGSSASWISMSLSPRIQLLGSLILSMVLSTDVFRSDSELIRQIVSPTLSSYPSLERMMSTGMGRKTFST